MSEHPSPDALERYRRGSLQTAELLAIDDHISACAECSHSFSSADALRRVQEALGGDHPTYEMLEQYVDGSFGDRESIDHHLAICRTCAAELADLRAVRPTAPRRRIWPALLAAAAAALILFGVLTTREDTEPLPSQPPRVITRPPIVTPAPPQAIPERWRKTYDQLLSGVVPSAGLVNDLRGDSERTRGTDVNTTAPRVLDPRGVIETTRPTFRFTVPENATSRVEVFDSTFTKIVSSPELTAGTWTPTRPYPRGFIYAWQVIITTPTTRTTIPTPPAPPARFKVLDAESHAALEDARRRGDHLVAALICAETGLIEEARREVELARARSADNGAISKIAEALR